MPNQNGVFRKKNEIEANYRINEQGWNSGHKSYKTTKQEGVYRITIIGDSYIEAFNINYNNSLAEKLEKKLTFPNEVYQTKQFEFHQRTLES